MEYYNGWQRFMIRAMKAADESASPWIVRWGVRFLCRMQYRLWYLDGWLSLHGQSLKTLKRWFTRNRNVPPT